MNVLPLITRELREQSRQSSTYWLRTAAAASLVGVAALYQVDQGSIVRPGLELFQIMHIMLLAAIWILPGGSASSPPSV